jgi:hypothetical protein
MEIEIRYSGRVYNEGNTFKAKAFILPKSLYRSNITAQVGVMHYFHGIPMGRGDRYL